VLQHHDTTPDGAEFTRLGLLTVPLSLILATLGLWAALQVIGG
jgi:arsenical pump membrane protein